MKSAILVDGGYFIKRYRFLYRGWQHKSAEQVVRDLYGGLLRNLRTTNKNTGYRKQLYRIFYYDCPPLSKRVQNPVSRNGFSFADTPEAKFRLELHEQLKRSRKVALRLGRLAGHGHWIINPEKTKWLLNKRITVDELSAEDVQYDVRQKDVDMRIGLDIASLAYKKDVDQIILVAGDSDFVPAAKLARREGIDFVLDPMWNHINPDLHEHIDGMVSSWPKPADWAC